MREKGANESNNPWGSRSTGPTVKVGELKGKPNDPDPKAVERVRRADDVVKNMQPNTE